ncbi:hypothetical protein SLS62_008194 [Diatrype stigma]|uniref:DRBM domain-containing protein n=1 Tax=Diatrype stigma TaxID=117547 RepID=A0AAN9YNW4_9PEZI
MDGLATVLPQVHTPIYSKLQEWILKQQEYEATNSRAAPLSKVQRRLLQELEQTLILESAPGPEPQLGDANWIGLLHEYRAAHPRYPGEDLLFTEEMVPCVPAVRWRSRVALEEAASASFPDDRGGAPPSFGKKKDAKQYAAKCAVEWLRAQNLMPADGVRFPKAQVQAQMQIRTPPRPVSSVSAVASPKAPSPSPAMLAASAAKRQKLSSPDSSSSPGSPATPAAAAAAAAARPSSSSSPVLLPIGTVVPAKTASGTTGLPQEQSSPLDADERSATADVAALCTRLNWQPPIYKLTQDPQHKGFWSGYAEFESRPGASSSMLPPADAGRVENAYGKKLAKQKIAEGLVPYLARALEARQEMIRGFWAQR